MSAPLPCSSPTATQWVACRGWFSEIPHDAPAWLRVEDGRIAEIASRPPDGAEAPDLYAVPLLADTHVHVYLEPWPVEPARRQPPGSEAFEVEVARAMRRVDAALAAGVGLLRDMGDPLGINLEVKRRLARRGAPAPELLVPGPGFHRPKKYGRYLGVARETAGEICAGIDELRARGEIDYVKVVTTGIVDFADRRVRQAPQYTAEELRAVVAHAHDRGYRVASHCSGQEGLDINLAAGVDFIEHAYFVREDQVDRMAAAGAAWTPTFAPVQAQGRHPESGWPEPVRRTIDAILAEHAARLAYAEARGVTLLAGTDAGSPGVSMGEGLRIELEKMAGAGLSAARVLRLATVDNARALGARRYAPALAVGGPASFALYARCPWEDLRHLGTLRHVWADGRRIT